MLFGNQLPTQRMSFGDKPLNRVHCCDGQSLRLVVRIEFIKFNIYVAHGGVQSHAGPRSGTLALAGEWQPGHPGLNLNQKRSEPGGQLMG